jgi:hypothetical protein
MDKDSHIRSIIENRHNLLDYFNEVFSPKRNKFKLITIENFDDVKDNHEIWFDGESIFMPIEKSYWIENTYEDDEEDTYR